MAKSLLSRVDREAQEARQWKKELQLADKREKSWRDEAEKIVKRYRAEEKKRNRVNILWSNTETLRPAIYNSRPNPDVRRRFRDADPLGKAVSEVLERSLSVMIDYECTDECLRNDALDGLLVGRGVSRIRYIPSIKQVPVEKPTEKEEVDEDELGVAAGEPQEEIEYEQVFPEHVDWRDFRHGFGRVWDEVPWEAFRHKLSRHDALKKFDEKDLAPIKFAVPESDDKKDPIKELQSETAKVAEFWEIWDKIGEKVFFLHEECEYLLYPKDNPEGQPPIKFGGFFPNPAPLMIIEDTGSTLPIIPFTLYQNQADELDRISARIDKIVNGMKLRALYDGKIESDLKAMMEGDDNELIPVQNPQAYEGGLDNALAWWPIEKAVAVLESLYEARDRQKAIIDEITGISDIIRGATDPDETAKAQELKQTNASVRLQRMQKEVQRYAKDLLRLAVDAMCDKFAPQTFAEMTELQFPTPEQKQMAQMQQPPQLGQPPPPPNPILQLPTWDDITGLMKSSGMRRFKVDVETDSTVAASLKSDMAGLSEVMVGVASMLEKLGPIVTSGALPVEAVKELVMTVIRRARMGIAVEDAFEKLKAPNPPPPPPEIAVAQMKAQSEEKLKGMEVQGKVQIAQAEQSAEGQQRQAEMQMELQKAHQEAQIEIQKDAQLKQHEFQLKQAEFASKERIRMAELENERLIADASNQTKVMVAEITAKAQLQAASMTAASYEKDEEGVDA